MIYLDDNGVTVKAVSGAKGAKAGEVYELNGEKYYVAARVENSFFINTLTFFISDNLYKVQSFIKS